MNAVTVTMNEATARTALREARDRRIKAKAKMDDATQSLRDLVVDVRPQGLLTVGEMATAIGRDRNFVDSVWSAHGGTVKGSQTRVPVVTANEDDSATARRLYDQLANAAKKHRKAVDEYDTAVAERNRLVVLIYQSRIIGPSPIGVEVGIDRNHVLRIARNAGVKAVHRTGSRNQYTTGK